MPEVSIITGAYNQSRYICETVESVINQTFKDYEHIIVDDGSSDNTREVLEPYMSQIIYVNQENQGNVASRNRGLEIAKGELIAILDGDDIWAPTKLEKQVKILVENPDVGLVYTGMREIDEVGDFQSEVKAKDIYNDPIRHQLLSNATPFSSILVRRSLLDNNVLLDPRFNLVGDRYMTLQVALQGYRFVCIPEGLLFLRTHSSSMRYSPKFRKNYLDQMLLLIEDIKNDSRLPRSYMRTIRNAYARAYFTAAWLIIDRGASNEMDEANILLCKSLRYDFRMIFSVIKQFIKSYVRFGKKRI